jgi:hypothetical protein
MQVGDKMMHIWTTINKFSKDSSWPKLGKCCHFPPYNTLCDWWQRKKNSKQEWINVLKNQIGNRYGIKSNNM